MKNTLIKKVFHVGVCVVLFSFGTSAFGATVYMPHITGGNPLWDDWLQVDNGDSSSHDFTITLYSGGTEVYSDTHMIAGYGHDEIDLKTLAGTATTGTIEYDSEFLLFRVSYEYVSTGAVAEFSLSDTLSGTLGFLFSGFISTVNAKGAAFANMSDTPAYVTLYAMGGDTILDTYSTTIGARDQIVGVHHFWFPSLSYGEIDSIIAVSSVECLSGVVICTECTSLSYLLFTPGIPVPVFDPSGAPDISTWAFSAGGSGDECGRCIQQTADGGCVVTGYTDSYGAGNLDLWVIKCDISGSVQWQKTYGGNADEYGYSIQQTLDSGYIVIGSTSTYGAGMNDLWALKLDSSGNSQWQKTYGGINNDEGYSIQQTSDAGYVMTASTCSYGAGGADLWVLKCDSEGEIQWQKTYGGSADECGYSIQQTLDSGYIVIGSTSTYGAGMNDLWVLKLDNSGKNQWQKTYGQTFSDEGYSIQQTLDGGYIVTGYIDTHCQCLYALWIMKIDCYGNIIWQKFYGETHHGYVTGVQQTLDGGYIVIGETQSYGNGGYDLWVIKLDNAGNCCWQKTYGGTSDEESYDIRQLSNGGYILVGLTHSFGTGNSDVWVLKIDKSGNILGCSDSIMTDITASPYFSLYSISNSLSYDKSVPVTVGTTDVSGLDSAAEITFQCSE